MQVDGFAGHERGDAIEQSSYEQVEVDASPRSAAAPPHHDQTRRQHEFFADVEQVKTPAIHDFNGVHILPRNDDEEIKEQPPRQQQGEIKRSDSYRAITLLNMRFNRHRSHHRNNMKEENDIADKWIRRLMSQVDFHIGPHELRRKPNPQAQAQKRPEQASFRGSSSHVADNTDRCAKKNEVLQDVPKSRESKSARREASTATRERTPPCTRWPSTSGRAGAENFPRFKLYVWRRPQVCYRSNAQSQTNVGCSSLRKGRREALHKPVNILI